MKKVLFAAAALSAALLSAAAVAQMPPQPGWNGAPQPGWHDNHGWDRDAFWRSAPESPRERIQFLQDRVNHGIADGSLDPREAGRVTHELNDVRE